MRELDYKSKKRIRIAAVIIIILLLLFWLLYTFTKGNKTAEAVENLDGQSISQEDENKNTNNSEENNIVDNNTSVISNTEENNTATVGDTTNVARRNRVNNAQTNRQTTNNVAQNTENTQNNAQNNNNNNEQTTIVTLIGRTNIELNINDVFNDEGVTVNDGSPVTTEYYFARNEDSDVWEKADTIDTSLPGSYKILYTVGSGVYKRTLKIVDNEAPVLTLNGETRISLEFGRDTYTELGVAVTENSSETINPTSKIYYSATGEEGTYNEVTEINNLILGSYKVVYTAKDSSNNSSEIERIINVVDTTKPVVESITLSNNGGRTNQDVTVTIKVNEAIKDVTGWNKVDDKTISKVFSANETNTVTIEDLAGNSIDVPYEVKDIDKTLPTGTVTYSTVDPTNQNVIVTITASKPILVPDGWTRGGKAYVITKEYSDNIDEKVTIKDLYGNEGSATVSISNIDRVAPVVESVTLSNNGGRTNQDVTVTIKVNEAIKDVTGWNKVDDKTISKVFSANETNTVTIEDLAGNSIDVPYEVKDIDKTLPTGTVTYSTVDPTNQNVIVTITASKPILVPDGWTRGGKAYVVTKEYSDNIDENITIKDLYGNENTVNVKIQNIDKIKPTVILAGVAGNKTYAEETIEADKTATYVDLGAIVTDNVDPDTTIVSATNINYVDGAGNVTAVNKVNMGVPGEYRLGYTYTDAAGNTAMARRIVKIVDTTAPVITPMASSTFEVGVDTYTYPEAGTVTDNVDSDCGFSGVHMKWYKATPEGEKGEEVAPFAWGTTLKDRELGKYYIEYKKSDNAGNVGTAHRIVTLQDTTAPKLTLNGNASMTLEAGIDTYTEEGATVTDNYDATISNLQPELINYSVNGVFKGKVSSVDTNKLGVYKIRYAYTDAAGNVGEDANRASHKYVLRVVTVKDTTAPVITLNGDANITLTDATSYTDALATVTDNHDATVNNLAPSYINYYSLTGAFRGRVNEVDVNAEGRYNLVYSTKDSSGNEAAKVTRIVYVKITNQTNKKFISTKEDLLNLATNPSEYTGKEVVITNNINLNGVNWNPINAGSGVLNGTIIDGRGHTISNMSINTTGEQSAGFIGFNASSVTIKNLTFENAKVKQDNAQQRYAGVVIGKNYSNITLENINVNNSEVENNWQCGGLVGFAETNGPKFKNCSITNSFVGGSNATAGSLFGLGIVSIEVENCKAENVRLYTDGMTWSSTQKALGNYWVGHIYGNTLTVNGSTETNVTVVDHK